MLSKKDERILSLLKKNAKLSSKQISGQTGIPVTTVHNRIKKLERDGVIRGYRAIVAREKTGKNVHAFVHIELGMKREQAVVKTLEQMPEVEAWYILTGETDILLKVSVADVHELNDLVLNKLKTVKSIKKTQTSLVLKGSD
ncbi:MAG: Lrp/AsnC family transcriptional regulator [Candidatus Aenigmarchaeota archaeon]|nr:Lrp/AsnC family transcriptional regulator [Candidatus Aenigmarchaeota archaeon]